MANSLHSIRTVIAHMCACVCERERVKHSLLFSCNHSAVVEFCCVGVDKSAMQLSGKVGCH